jgi:hypothetical protein
VTNVKERPTSPSVKQLVRQYYHNRDRDRKQMELEEAQKNLPDFQEEENTTIEQALLNYNDEEEMERIESNMGSSLSSSKSVSKRSTSTASSSHQERPPQTEEVKSKFPAKKTDEFYEKRNMRPRTVPHEIYHDESLMNEIKAINEERKSAANTAKESNSRHQSNASKLSKSTKSDFSYPNTEENNEADSDSKSVGTAEEQPPEKTDNDNANEDDNDDVIVSPRFQADISSLVEIKDDNASVAGQLDKPPPGSSASSRKDNAFYDEDEMRAMSDVYPRHGKHALMSEAYDRRLDMRQMRESADVDDLRAEHENELGTAREEELAAKAKEEHDRNEAAMARLVPTHSRGVQVTDYDLNKHFRKIMENQRLARRLEYSEMLAERLVTSALLAGSDENITVNCILLPGCNLF